MLKSHRKKNVCISNHCLEAVIGLRQGNATPTIFPPDLMQRNRPNDELWKIQCECRVSVREDILAIKPSIHQFHSMTRPLHASRFPSPDNGESQRSIPGASPLKNGRSSSSIISEDCRETYSSIPNVHGLELRHTNTPQCRFSKHIHNAGMTLIWCKQLRGKDQSFQIWPLCGDWYSSTSRKSLTSTMNDAERCSKLILVPESI